MNIETIRYYERIRLLAAPPRTASGRRLYRPRDLQVLVFIRRARELGFPVDDVRTLLRLEGMDKRYPQKVKQIAAVQLKAIRGKISDLSKLERLLAKTLSRRRSGNRVPGRPVLDALSKQK